MNEDLMRLKEVTRALDFSSLVHKMDNCPQKAELEMIVGDGVVHGIVNMPGYSIAEAHVSKGGKFSPHVHKQFEVLVVYEGHAIIHVGNRSVSLREKSSFYIEAGTIHSLDFPKATKLIAVTIPESDALPEGK
jgi:mannose-6-phosphate isomerase-like protein (cupin superfamily)